jgi:CPA1 family monovalent cation:H+ antiporter
MTAFELVSVLVTVAALLSFANQKLLRVPATIGIMVLSLGFSALVLIAGNLAGGLGHSIVAVVQGIDFNRIVLHGLLAFLLFAGSLHLDVIDLRKQRRTVLALSIISTVLSTACVGGLVYLAFPLLGFRLPLSVALLFGALIAPTDPIAVLAILRGAGISRALRIQLSGEALFNDGVGAVLFVTLLESAGHPAHLAAFGKLLLVEAGGGILIGLVAGLATRGLLQRTDEYQTEILLTLALAIGGFALADSLHVSAPLEAVVAGLCLGQRGRGEAFSARAQDYVDKFWELVDSMCNAVLFLLMGLELLVVPFHARFLLAGLVAVLLVLMSRWTSVAVVLLPGLVRKMGFCPELLAPIHILTWGGLRGGLSIALALSLPALEARGLLLTTTYVVVVFAIVVQGLTMPRLAHHYRYRRPKLIHAAEANVVSS